MSRRRVFVKKNAYWDSVNLMILSSEIAELPGVHDVAVLMGTPGNRARLAELGYEAEAMNVASAQDVCVGVELDEDEIVAATVREKLDTFLSGRGMPADAGPFRRNVPRTLRSALRQAPDSALVSISVPGEQAAVETERALESGRHVFLFSDNVSPADERRLKLLARKRRLLLMGPDCGTALVNGIPLGFCNRVPRGPVGIVAASGTGAQAIMSHLAASGVGVSHVLGAGGRDLSEEVGGLTFKPALDALARDAATEVIILLSKTPAMEVQDDILQRAAAMGKPTVVCFIGRGSADLISEQLVVAPSLADAARFAIAILAGNPLPAPIDMDAVIARYGVDLTSLRAGRASEQHFVRGLYSGGTLAAEAALVLSDWLTGVQVENDGAASLSDAGPAQVSGGNRVVDLGDDRFTRGRAHPMIDGSLRNHRLMEEAADPSVAVILLDVVLGLNAASDPAGSLSAAITEARDRKKAGSHSALFIAYICGTDADPQNLDEQRKKLETVGCLVCDSNVEAALAAAFVAADPPL